VWVLRPYCNPCLLPRILVIDKLDSSVARRTDDYGLLAPESGNVIASDSVDDHYSSWHHTWQNPITSPLLPNSSIHTINAINASV
jgi:hypothetical protein